MKMLTEGNQKLSNYVIFFFCDGFQKTHINASSAQEAVNTLRENDPEVTIIKVAKVVKNWK